MTVSNVDSEDTAEVNVVMRGNNKIPEPSEGSDDENVDNYV